MNSRWKMEIPIIMDLIQTQVLCHINTHIQEHNYIFFSKVYLEYNKKTKMFLKLSLRYYQFTNRCSLVSQNATQLEIIKLSLTSASR